MNDERGLSLVSHSETWYISTCTTQMEFRKWIGFGWNMWFSKSCEQKRDITRTCCVPRLNVRFQKTFFVCSKKVASHWLLRRENDVKNWSIKSSHFLLSSEKNAESFIKNVFRSDEPDGWTTRSSLQSQLYILMKGKSMTNWKVKSVTMMCNISLFYKALMMPMLLLSEKICSLLS